MENLVKHQKVSKYYETETFLQNQPFSRRKYKNYGQENQKLFQYQYLQEKL